VGFSPKSLNTKKILDAVTKGKIKGIAILSGSNNVKYTQDHEMVTLAQEFLKNDILCLSRGEASVTLAKYGFLNPNSQKKEAGKGLSDLLSSFQKEIPSIIDLGGGDESGAIDFLLDLANVKKN
jgi:hydroxylamine reductase (hybrid-cluster protein)